MKNIFLILIGDPGDGNPQGIDPEEYNKLQKGVKRSQRGVVAGAGLEATGGVIAAAVPGPFGAVIGGIVSAIGGITQGVSGAIEKHKAKEMAPGEQDPNQIAMINRLRRLRETYSTGSEASEYHDTLNRGLSAKIKGIGQQAGGSTGQIMSGIAGAQDKEQEAYNQILATLEKNRIGVLGLENQDTNDAAQRALDVKDMLYNQKLAAGYGNIKTGQSNLFAGGENLLSGLSDIFKNIHPQNSAGGGATAIPGGGVGADNAYQSNYQNTDAQTINVKPSGSFDNNYNFPQAVPPTPVAQ